MLSISYTKVSPCSKLDLFGMDLSLLIDHVQGCSTQQLGITSLPLLCTVGVFHDVAYDQVYFAVVAAVNANNWYFRHHQRWSWQGPHH